MTKVNIIEFTDKANLIHKTPYQVNDWEVTSVRSESDESLEILSLQ